MSENNINNNQIIETINKLIGFMNVSCQIEVKEEPQGTDGKVLVVSLHTEDDARFLIGKNGQNLKALEHVIRAIFTKSERNTNIVLDINDYRKSRTAYLIDTAKQIVARVRNSKKAEALPPMTSYERRVVHMELAAYPDIATESIGAEPLRRVIIKPYP